MNLFQITIQNLCRKPDLNIFCLDNHITHLQFPKCLHYVCTFKQCFTFCRYLKMPQISLKCQYNSHLDQSFLKVKLATKLLLNCTKRETDSHNFTGFLLRQANYFLSCDFTKNKSVWVRRFHDIEILIRFSSHLCNDVKNESGLKCTHCKIVLGA